MVIAILPRRPLPAMFKRPFEFLGIGMPRPAKVTRVSKATRDKIIKAASRAFARNGHEGASIRAIVPEGGRRSAVAVWAMQHFRSQRRPACEPSAPPQDRRTLRGRACRYDRHLGRGRAWPAANADAVLGRVR